MRRSPTQSFRFMARASSTRRTGVSSVIRSAIAHKAFAVARAASLWITSIPSSATVNGSISVLHVAKRVARDRDYVVQHARRKRAERHQVRLVPHAIAPRDDGSQGCQERRASLLHAIEPGSLGNLRKLRLPLRALLCLEGFDHAFVADAAQGLG